MKPEDVQLREVLFEFYREGNAVRVGPESLPFEALVKMAYLARVPLSATGFYATPKIHWDRVRHKGLVERAGHDPAGIGRIGETALHLRAAVTVEVSRSSSRQV